MPSPFSTPNTSISESSNNVENYLAAQHTLTLSSSRRSIGSASTESPKSRRSLWFGKSSSKSTAGPYLLTQASFNATGQTLYLWKARETQVAILPIFEPSQITQTEARVRRLRGPAHFVTGGNSKLLGISCDGSPTAHIEVYPNGISENEAVLEPMSFKLTSDKDSFAFSRDDKWVAVSSGKQISIWDIDTRISTIIDIPATTTNKSRPGIESQQTAFSANCESITIATRFLDGNVFIQVWSLDGRLKTSITMKALYGVTHDYGLSAVFVDNELRTAIVAVMASTISSVLQSLAKAPQFMWPGAALQGKRFSYKIASAAQSGSGHRYALALSDNRVFAFTLEQRKVDVQEVASFSSDRRNCTSLADAIALACPDEERIFCFFANRENTAMNFVVIEDGKVSQRHNVRSCFGYT